MSYAKAMKHARNVRKCRAQSRMHFGFATLAPNERRKEPWLGAWTLTASEERIANAIEHYHAETRRMLAANPDLKLI